MHKILLLILFGTVFQSISSEEINSENLFNFLNEKQFLEAKFTQTTYLNSRDRIIKGTIKATRGGLFKLDYLEPIQETISADKRFLYKLDIELEQLDIVPREEYFKDTPINIFITKTGDIDKLYLIDSCTNDNKLTICALSPKDKDSFVEKLFLKFLKTDLKSLSYLDSFGQLVELEFEGISWKPFPVSQLLIEVPEGIDVVYH